jgi:transcriptional regulator with XRE-family HTH domain
VPNKKPSTQPLDALSLAVGERVLQLREERGLAPYQLAGLAGMDQNYLWRIEAGRQNLSLRTAARLAKALGVTLAQLFEGVNVIDVELGTRAYTKRAGHTGTGDDGPS